MPRREFAGFETYTLNDNAADPIQNQVVPGAEYRVEGYWKDVAGKSWMDSEGNPAALNYAMRAGMTGLPIDDNVLYGKIGPFGHLVHVSEIQE